MSEQVELSKAYDPREVESRWYAKWLDHAYFAAKDDSSLREQSFCIVIPPPNVTGSLHCGHALFATIQDILTRHARMQQLNALWLPGIDHAGIATQVVVERLLKKEGVSRLDLGRAKFLSRVWDWKEKSGGMITSQLKVMGASLDWSRERFTMDAQMSRAVREAFVRLHEEGLIYRAERLVNWSIGSQTVLSDLEVDSEEEDGELFEFAYEFVDDPAQKIVVATTRPETMLGDTAVAVHPDDPRYRNMIGRQLRHPFIARTIPIIGDAILVDPAFGTGAVKVTPAHDFNDFATGKRHALPMITIMNRDGTLNSEAGEFAGMERFAARKAVKAKLEELGLAVGSKKHRLFVPRCQRTNTVVEPLLSEQWYVKADVLAKPAIEAVESGRTQIVPEEWTKTYMHWMTNIQDWCISRQLWWGHQIPAWHCNDCGKITVSREDPHKCQYCQSESIKQDEDVLDTWFSSGLWPFATLGWPDKTEALATFYPTTIMETGFDILFFWVARMMMFGLHFMGDVPFAKVYLHGMVTDEKGDKMSKVKGNVIDPLDVVYGISQDDLVEKIRVGGATESALKNVRVNFAEGIPAYGADALRWTLATYPPQQRKIPLSIKRIEGGRHVCNKLWNSVRFAMPYLASLDPADFEANAHPHSLYDRWILSRLSHTTNAVNTAISEFRLDDATTALYRFFWTELCDWYLELSKTVLASSDSKAARVTLARALEATLRLMHPVIPFVTEELWQRLPKLSKVGSIVIANYPKEGDFARDEAAEKSLAILQSAIERVRSLRGDFEVPHSATVDVQIVADNGVLFLEHLEEIRALTKANVSVRAVGEPRPIGFAATPGIGCEVRVKMRGLVTPESLKDRIEREEKKFAKEKTSLVGRLSNPSFVSRAPPDEVEKVRVRIDELTRAAAILDAGRSLIGELIVDEKA